MNPNYLQSTEMRVIKDEFEIMRTNKPAMLAPVPEEHLISGRVTCEGAGKVAFGSRAFEFFRQLDAMRGGASVEVYIYASASSKFGLPKARWRACYVGHVEAKAGGHPEGMKFRPDATLKYPSDNEGHWAVFWEVTDLREVEKDEALPMNIFRGWQSEKFYVSGFVPEGPLLIQAP